MTVRQRWGFVVFCVIGAAFIFCSSTASAHGSWSLFVARQDGSRPAPVVDGNCSVSEYGSSVRYSILYRPRFNWSPAQLRLVADNTYLYLCLSGMPRQLGSVTPSVSVAFDPNHSGGSAAENDDLNLTLSENNTLMAYRGDGTGGFVVDPDITGWNAVAHSTDDITWSAEFSIPLSLIGGGAPWSTIGFHIRHNWLRSVGDDYAWPPSGGWNVPDLWGDLLWGEFPSFSLPVLLDVFRISQGLETDVTGHVSYDLIAAKDTVVRAQLYTLGAIRDVAYSACRVQQISLNIGSFNLPIRGTAYLVPVSYYPAAPRVNALPAGFFGGLSTFSCYLNGSYLALPGDYHFEMLVTVAGSRQQVIGLGIRSFKSTAVLRLLLASSVFPPWHPEYLPWNNALAAAIPEAMSEYNRRFPLASGTGNFNWNGLSQERSSGLRYFLLPGTYNCPAPSGGQTLQQATAECDVRARNLASEARQIYNVMLSMQDHLDGRHRDRFDQETLLVTTPDTGGGQAQFWAGSHCSPGLGFESTNVAESVTVLGQETAHCFGQVRASSPHSNRGNHSTTWDIPLDQGRSEINTRTRQDVPAPVSMLNGAVANVGNTFLEGWEWNDLRRTFLSLQRSTHSQVHVVVQPLFVLRGLIDSSDIITVDYSARVDDLELDLTPSSLDSSYALIFLNAQNTELGRLQFQRTISDTHGTSKLDSLFLTAELPQGATRVEIRNGSNLLYSQNFSVAAPVLSNVSATPDGKGNIVLQWKAYDQDSTQLQYGVYLFFDPDSPPFLLARGLTETNFVFPFDIAPATPNGKLIIEASDGYNTTKATSNAFVIPNRTPLAMISSPTVSSTVVAGQPFMLVGAAYDFTTGPLSGSALIWSSNQVGLLGSGDQLAVKLSAGLHEITLVAMSTTGLSTTVKTSVNVLSDSDHDGLPDSYEINHSCLSSSTFDSNADPDSDGTSSLMEWEMGTDPCNADSDNDGIGDGDEARLGSNPLDAGSLPLPDQLYLSTELVDLGECPSPMMAIRSVRTVSDTTSWYTFTDAGWLSATLDGTGNGQVSIQANCASLGAAGTYIAHVFAGTAGGQLNTIEARLLVPHQTYLPLVRK